MKKESIFFAEERKTKKENGGNICLGKNKEEEENTRDWSVPDRSDNHMMI